MSKKFKILLAVCIIISIFTIVGCSNTNSQSNSTVSTGSGELKKLKIGTSPALIEMVKAVETSLEDEGYDLELVPFNDVIQPNTALLEDEVDCTIHQHEPYLNAYNNDNGTDLYFAAPLVSGFQALYSEKHDTLEQIPENARIGTYEDLSNQHRSLVFAESIGLIKLGEPSSDGLYTILDIVENPKNIDFVTLDRGGLVQGLQDLDACFINSSLLAQANKDPEAHLAIEEEEAFSKYATGLVVRNEDKDVEWIDAIIRAYQTQETKDNIDDYFNGSYVVVIQQ